MKWEVFWSMSMSQRVVAQCVEPGHPNSPGLLQVVFFERGDNGDNGDNGDKCLSTRAPCLGDWDPAWGAGNPSPPTLAPSLRTR